MPDCGDNSCRYANPRNGMRTNGGCRCDRCEMCNRDIRPESSVGHRDSCPQKDWIPVHHRKSPISRRPGTMDKIGMTEFEFICTQCAYIEYQYLCEAEVDGDLSNTCCSECGLGIMKGYQI